ncbi:hypothetical protein K0U83_20350 [bacterium]|nr:hypothetical protein [bacterium]
MAQHNDPWARIMDAAKRGARDDIHTTIKNSLPEGAFRNVYSAYVDNPRSEEPEEEELEQELPFVLGLDSSLTFEFADDPERNLRFAAAAFRLFGTPECIVAMYPHTGTTFFGPLADLEDLCAQRDINVESWEAYDDAASIMSLDVDQEAVGELVSQVGSDGQEQARQTFQGFHWGDKPKTTAMVEIPGVSSADLSYLGVARQISYGRDGEQLLSHVQFGQDDQYPLLYALRTDTLIIYGGPDFVQQMPSRSGYSFRNSAPNIPGVDCHNLRRLGSAKQILYGAQKSRRWQEYYHDFGEKSREYPCIYALGDNAVLIHGGQMRVEPRGIVE